MKEKTVKELLDHLQEVADLLNTDLPKKKPLFISKSIDPAKALHIREACAHRIAELAESACCEFKKNKLVAGYVLARAILETLALFWYFIDKIKETVTCGKIEEAQQILTRMMLGIKIDVARKNVAKSMKKTVKEMGKSLDPIHVMDLIRHVAETHPTFEDIYAFLSEVSHPNATGLIRAYVKMNLDEKSVYFGKNDGTFDSQTERDLQALITCLEIFMDLYNESASLLAKFRTMCESDIKNNQGS